MAINFTSSDSGAEPYRQFDYTVEIGGTEIAGFTQVSGISVETDVMEYREGGVHDATHKFPNATTQSNVQLHRGVTKHDDLIKWITQSMTIAREDAQKDVVISMKDVDGKTVWGFKLKNCYPVKWAGPEMTASASEFAMEFVELSYESLELIKSG